MEDQIKMIAERLKEMRILMGYSPEEMAEAANTTVEEYLRYESGEEDFYFNFLYNCATKLEVDISELVTGSGPRLSAYTICRKGKGMPIRRRQGFEYLHLAYLLKDRLAEPHLVRAIYDEDLVKQPILTSVHPGQEFDYVLEGKLKVKVDNFTEILEAGDSIYYNSDREHGMVAMGGEDCLFLAVVIKGGAEG